jgi:hypothetical protein
MIDTSSEAWRAQCEARHVLNEKPTLAQRRAFLELVEARRGKAGRRALEDAIRQEWDRRKKSA